MNTTQSAIDLNLQFECIVDLYDDYLQGNGYSNFFDAESDGTVFYIIAYQHIEHLRLVESWSAQDTQRLQSMLDEYIMHNHNRYRGEWEEKGIEYASETVQDYFRCACDAFETYWYWQQ